MKWNPEPGLADPQEAIEFFIGVALEGNQSPPKEFVESIMTGKASISFGLMEKLVDRGWLPRTKCEVWSRVMGYFRPVSQWNVGKKAEYAERFKIDPNKMKF